MPIEHLWNAKEGSDYMEDKLESGERSPQAQELYRMKKAQEFLTECAKMMCHSESYESLVRDLIKKINKFFCADHTAVATNINEDLVHCLTYDVQHGSMQEDHTIKKVKDYLQWQTLLQQHEFFIIQDIPAFVKQYPFTKEFLDKPGLHTLFLGAMMKGTRLNGYFVISNPNIDMIAMLQPVFETLCMDLMISFKNWQDDAMMKKLSKYDSLTGLKNRDCFIKEVKEFPKTSSSVGVINLDMNGLKDINDRFGHARGDDALVECAKLLNRIFSTSPHSNLYRMGGDEFIVICLGISNTDFYEDVLELKKECELNTCFKAAIGFVWSDTVDYLNDLVSEADFKMYEDKKRFYRTNLTSNRYRHYHDDVLELVEPKILHDRLDKNAFLIYLQPKFSFHDKSLIGAEALIRYQSFDGTILLPGQFLPLLEDANLIMYIDFFVFDEICKKQKEWTKQGKQLVPISTNFSRYSILERDFVKKLDAIIEKYELDKNAVEIEITETVDGFEGFHLIDRIDEVRTAGYAISIDDFGAQYANLSLFTSVDFNVLKIDKSLIDNIVSNTKAQSVIASIVTICRSIDVKIIVEGVETYLQFETLKRLGCEGIQGFLFSKPLPLDEYERVYMKD